MSRTANQNEQDIATARLLASGNGWRVLDVVCRAGPHDKPFEEQHRWVSLSAVMAGQFLYRSTHGRYAMTPGSVLLGNSDACFSCGHDHSTGDRCLSFQFAPDLFEEITAATPGARTVNFTNHRLPPLESMSPLFSEMAALVRSAHEEPESRPWIEDTALHFAGQVLRGFHDGGTMKGQPQDIRRVLAVTDYIDRSLGTPLTLEGLAKLAGVSRYYFLRMFSAVVGTTPYRYILMRRMARAGTLLVSSDLSVLVIALECGFGDLSEFTRRFRARYGMPPALYRKHKRKK